MSLKLYLKNIGLIVFVFTLLAACDTASDPLTLNLGTDVTQVQDMVYVNDKLDVKATVTGAPEKVELLANDDVVAELKEPYSYTWDTRNVNNGVYALSIRAERGGQTVKSSLLNVTVDHNAPIVLKYEPKNAETIAVGTPFRVTFNEAVMLNGDISAEDADGKELELKVEMEGSRTRWKLELASPPAKTTEITVNLMGNITDLAGNALKLEDKDWTFTLVVDGNVPEEQPESPETPESPENPESPEQPESPENPENPESPETPEQPENPETPTKPENPASAQWQQLGKTFEKSRSSAMYLLGVNPLEQPVILRVNFDTNALQLLTYSGGAWQSSDLPLVNAGVFSYHDLATLDAKGNLLMPYITSSFASDHLKSVGIKRWDGSVWQDVGDRINDSHYGQDESLAKLYPEAGSDTNIIAEWIDETNQIYSASRWDGKTWQQLAQLSRDEAISFNQPVYFLKDAFYRTFVTQQGDSYTLTAEKLTAGKWQAVTSALGYTSVADKTVRSVKSLDMTLGSDGKLYLIYEDDSLGDKPGQGPKFIYGAGSRVYAANWDGASWQAMGGTLGFNPENDTQYADLQLSKTGSPVIHWKEDEPNDNGFAGSLYVKRWNGNDWTIVEGSLINGDYSSFAFGSMALKANGDPVVFVRDEEMYYAKGLEPVE